MLWVMWVLWIIGAFILLFAIVIIRLDPRGMRETIRDEANTKKGWCYGCDVHKEGVHYHKR